MNSLMVVANLTCLLLQSKVAICDERSGRCCQRCTKEKSLPIIFMLFRTIYDPQVVFSRFLDFIFSANTPDS
jgi:hypothetical protein